MTRKAKLEKALAFNIWFFNKNVLLYNNDVIDDAEKHHEKHLATLHAALIEAVEALEFALKYLNDTNDCGRYCDLSVDWHTPECCMETSFTKALAKIDDVLEGTK